jgi:hypothetical protein
MKRAVYAAPVLTGIAGIGAALVADDITRLHILASGTGRGFDRVFSATS